MADEHDSRARPTRELTISLDPFAWSAISEESHKLGVSAEDLARFAVLYYLADLDSGRIARRIQGTFSLQDA